MKFVLHLPSYSEHDAWRIETSDKNFLFCFYFHNEIIMTQSKINLYICSYLWFLLIFKIRKRKSKILLFHDSFSFFHCPIYKNLRIFKTCNLLMLSCYLIYCNWRCLSWYSQIVISLHYDHVIIICTCIWVLIPEFFNLCQSVIISIFLTELTYKINKWKWWWDRTSNNEKRFYFRLISVFYWNAFLRYSQVQIVGSI